MSGFKIFIVEDDPWYGELLKHHLSLNSDLEVFLFQSSRDCLANLYQKPDVFCVDYLLPDTNGEILLGQLLKWNPDTSVIIISAQDKISVAVDLLKKGARDYFVKNEHTTDMLWQTLHNILENVKLKRQIDELQKQINSGFLRDKIIGESEAIKNVLKLIEKASASEINISLTGESGTGKEVVAKTIHYNSCRKIKPFIAVNMAAIPSELVESELFGYEKGAFTGAISRKHGKFEEAQGGTIFLDEICEMNLNLQSKILRVLQEREIVRVGGNSTVRIDVRLITATNKNLIEEVKKGNFREDLFYRILGMQIEMPPLRIRRGDVILLAESFMNEFNRGKGKNQIILSRDAKMKLLKYHFPGNVRELRSVIELSCVMCQDNIINSNDIIFQSLDNKSFKISESKTMLEYRNEILSFYLKKMNFNVLKVAKELDIGKSTIYNFLKEKGIETE